MSEAGKRIRQQRQRLGLTQEELAERLHVTRQAVSNWETGRNEPDLDTLTAAASALGLEPGALLGGEAPAPPEAGAEAQLRSRRQAALWTAVLGGISLLALLDALFLAPRLLELRARTFRTLPQLVNDLAVLPLGRVAGGMLIPAAVSLFAPVQPKGPLRTALRILGPALLLPWLLTMADLLFPVSLRVLDFLLRDPTGSRLRLVCRLLPALAGLCLWPGYVRLGRKP